MENVNTMINEFFSFFLNLNAVSKNLTPRKAQNSPAFEKLFSPPLLSCNRCANICLVNFSSNPEPPTKRQTF